jgi:O-antigen/teichoic acid export membrane protein
MDRDKLDFVLVGSVGVALVLYLAAAILNDLGLFPFYIENLRSDSPTLYMLALACCLLVFLPLGFFLERRMMRYQSTKRNWHEIPIPSREKPVRADEENHARS